MFRSPLDDGEITMTQRMKSAGGWNLAAAAMLALGVACANDAAADFHTYKIDQVYSDAAGAVQFVVLHEALGEDGQQFWNGHSFTTLSHNGNALTNYTFPANISSSFVTSGTYALIASAGYAALNLVTPDYVLPNGFLDRAGGT